MAASERQSGREKEQDAAGDGHEGRPFGYDGRPS